MDREKVIKEFAHLLKVIKALECCCDPTMRPCLNTCPYRDMYDPGNGFKNCMGALLPDILALLKEQEVRELTIDEWRAWKANPNRNPICDLWENDISPMWILNPNDVHEPALLMGKLKLFTGKLTPEQCKEVKW